MSQLMAMAAAAPAEHADIHESAAKAMASVAPQATSASVGDLITRARAMNIPWAKILAALATAAMGGFTPASIAAAIAMLFGTTPATP